MFNTRAADATASVAELAKAPKATLARGDNLLVAITDQDDLEDIELNAIADARRNHPTIKISLDDL